MLIRVSGGSGGIKEYLEEGVKNGREFTRNELDERVILDGDLEFTDQIIKNMDTEGQRYLHITLSFKEDHVDNSTLREISDEFKSFAMKSYQDDEYVYYAEAHLPKIKTYTDRSTGETVERKPHIHVVIPETNLITEQRLEPFGLVRNNEHYIDAFQEVINEKYQLASPKIHVRTTFTDESTIISRNKADIFPALNREIKTQALEVLLKDDIHNLNQFSQSLKAAGFEVKTRNRGKDNEYLNIRPPNATKGVNLKENVFKAQFVALPKEEKIKQLDPQYEPYRENGSERYLATKQHHEVLQYWNTTRAYELRYVNSRNRETYKSLSTEDKAQFINEKRIENDRAYGQRINPKPSFDDINEALRAADTDLRNAQRYRGNIESGIRNLNRRRVIRAAFANINGHSRDQATTYQPRKSSCELEQRAYDLNNRLLPDIKNIKKEIDATSLLNSLSKTHGLNPDKYTITQARDGSPRIVCGNRKLNTGDFLTKEMNLSWKEAKQYLESRYLAQKGLDLKEAIVHQPEPNVIRAAWRHQLDSERNERKQYLQEYRLEKSAIFQDKTLSKEERNIALSITQMNKVIRDIEFKTQCREAREHILAQIEKKENIMREEIGVVLSHEKAHYQHNKDNNMSYVVRLENHGTVREIWGKDLERVMTENNIKEGDKIKLSHEGKNIDTHRNNWTAEPATDLDIKRHAIKRFNITADQLQKSEQEALKSNRPSHALNNLYSAAESLGTTAYHLGINKNPLEKTTLNRHFQEGYRATKQDIKLSTDSNYQEWRQKEIENVKRHKTEIKEKEKNKEPIKKPEKELSPDSPKFYDKNLQASRILIHFQDLKEKGITAHSISKTEKGDIIEYGNKKLTISQLLKETQQLKPKEIVEKLKPIYEAQQRDIERVINYKNNYMQNERPSISDLEKGFDKKTSSENKIEHQKVPERIIEPALHTEDKEKKKSHEVLKPIQISDEISHKTNDKGHVSYYAGKDKLITDQGKRIVIEHQSDKAVEIGVRLAIEKYGNELDINGTKEYKQQVIDVVAKNKLNVAFKDEDMNKQLAVRRAQFEKGENIITKAEINYKQQNNQEQKVHDNNRQQTQSEQKATTWER
ncbi:LPD7 domain-containing protein [Photobacterium damselae]|uniref:LPD7 domain-containing protein n=1 Tax=Photobacterium damselae TaxID=38293 RepID=UPI00165D7649|nr:LPD7 domain-containing protein [Photobacterium damselae]